MKIGCIIQARNTSSRLPEKVMLPLPLGSSTPVLGHVVSRVKRVEKIDCVIVATTVNSEDNRIEDYAKQLKVASFRGSEDNVLSRFYLAALEHDLDMVIRITSDCPCLDPGLLEELIEFHLEGNYDYSSNAFERTLPHGMDAEIFTFKCLKDAYDNATEKFELEHVTPYIYKTMMDSYTIGVFRKEFEKDVTDIRVTLDTKEDYMLLCAVFDSFCDEIDFGIDELIELFNDKPWLYYINNNVEQKRITVDFTEQLNYAKELLIKQELNQVVALIEEKTND